MNWQNKKRWLYFSGWTISEFKNQLKITFFSLAISANLRIFTLPFGYVLERDLASFPIDVENYTDDAANKYYSPAGHHYQKDHKTTGQIKF